MRKKILLAEQSDSTRSIIETILRQNGFEVVSIPDYDRAVDVLGLSKPDILIIGSDLIGAGDNPLYSYILDNEIYSSIPIILLASDDDNNILPYPEEVIVRRPFDTNELLEKVKIFVGQGTPEPESVNIPTDLLGTMNLDDEFLDAALGLDHISVTDSEEMNKTSTLQKNKIGNEKVSNIGDFDELNETNKVESIMIQEDQTDIRRPATQKTIIQPNASGKLDILQDQYGMSEQTQKALEPEDSAHDYHWFVNEMQNDSKQKSAAAPISKNDDHQLGSIKIEETVQPLTSSHISGSGSVKSKSKEEGVEKFIDEFKREMEKIHSDKKTATVTIRDEKPQISKSAKSALPQANEQILSEAVRLFTKQFTVELAGKLAKEIAVKIDSEKLLVLIKKEILAELKKK